MHLIAVTKGGPRWETCQAAYPEAVPFFGIVGSKAHTHRFLARHAVKAGWDLDTLVIQDDVRFQGFLPPTPDRFTVYGLRRQPDHTCPQAYRADPQTWAKLAEVWDGSQACHAWNRLVSGLEVSNIASDPPRLAAVGRKAGCRSCGH